MYSALVITIKYLDQGRNIVKFVKLYISDDNPPPARAAWI